MGKTVVRMRQQDTKEKTDYVYKTPHDVVIGTVKLMGVGVNIL